MTRQLVAIETGNSARKLSAFHYAFNQWPSTRQHREALRSHEDVCRETNANAQANQKGLMSVEMENLLSQILHPNVAKSRVFAYLRLQRTRAKREDRVPFKQPQQVIFLSLSRRVWWVSFWVSLRARCGRFKRGRRPEKCPRGRSRQNDD
eukprot:scaffold1170_cov174-Amphora_coffeaeformis.AAC.36